MSTAVFLAVVAGVLVALAAPIVRASPRPGVTAAWALGLTAVWLTLTGLPTFAGWLDPAHPLPVVPLFMATILGSTLVLGLSGRALAFARTVPLWALVGFQGFRLPLELVLHAWVGEGIAPPQMTWTGANPDIVTGVVSLAAAAWLARGGPRGAAWVAWGVGAVLLANVLRVVVLSLPTPLQAWPDPIRLPFLFPQVWIASVCVAGALLVHVLTLRVLRA